VLLIAIASIGLATWRWMKARSNSASNQAHVTVGSKDFTESELLAEIVAQTLESKSIAVDRQFDLGGNLSHSSLVAGKIDLYPEYSGTSFTEIFCTTLP